MADPFVVDESFKKKLYSLKVTELHSLLRNLGASYQANKDQLVKRLIQKYIQIYEQYISGAMSFQEAKSYGDWVNEGHVVNNISPIIQPPPKAYPYPAPRLSGKSSIAFNISNTHPANTTSTNYASSHNYGSNVNNNSYNHTYNNNGYNNNMYNTPKQTGYMTAGGTVNQYKPQNPPPSTTLKSLSEINYKPASELIFPKSADPFLEIETTLNYSRLKTYSETRGRPTSFSFQVSETISTNVKSGAWRVIVRSFEIQNNLVHVSPPHAWPTECTLAINGNYMNLGVKKQTKPNAPPHPDKPLDISAEIRAGRNSIDITHTSSRIFAVVIDAMRVISVDTLVDVVKRNKTATFDSAKKTISLALSGDDKEIAALHTTVSLQCPLGRTPLVLPAKSLSCRHIQCFDLRNYLMMNQRTPSWKCPVCSAVTNTSNLIIDAYFSELLKHVDSSSFSEVHIDPSGDWSTAKPKASTKQEQEKAAIASKQAISIIATSPPTAPQKVKKPAVDVVDLISDDEDEVVPAPSKKIRIEDSPQPSYRPMPVITSLMSPPSTFASAPNTSITSTSKPSPSSARRGSASNSTNSTYSSTLPPLDLNEPRDQYSSPPETEFRPDLQNITSDLDPSTPSSENKKKASILVKLKYPPEQSPPQEPALSSSLSAVSLSSSSSTFSPPPTNSGNSESYGTLSSLEATPETHSSTGTLPPLGYGYHTHSSFPSAFPSSFPSSSSSFPSSTTHRDHHRYSSRSYYNTSPSPSYGHHGHSRPYHSPSYPPSSSSSSYYSPPNNSLNYSYDLGDYFDDFEPYDNNSHTHYSPYDYNYKTSDNSNNTKNNNYNNNNTKDDDLYDTYNSYYTRSYYHPTSSLSSPPYRYSRESEYNNNSINHYHPASVTSSDIMANDDNNTSTNNYNNYNSNSNNNNTNYDTHDNYNNNNNNNNNNNDNYDNYPPAPSPPPARHNSNFSPKPSSQAVIEISDDDGD